MITTKEYFENFLSWQKRTSNLRSAPSSYETYANMPLVDLRPEAEAGNPGAQEELAERYLFGLDDIKTDPKQAQALFQQAADQGHPDAMHMLAEIHRMPEYGMQDLDAYFPLLKKAAEGGSWKAMFNLACAYYKGKAGYDGHGFDVDKIAALKWSTACSIRTMELLEFYFTHTCSEGFKDYMEGVFALFVQSVSVTARQIIRGDGVEKDPDYAKSLLTNAQNFYKHFFGIECADFSNLLKYC